MRSLLVGGCALVAVLVACGGAPGPRLVCEDVLGDGSTVPINCERVVAAAEAELGPAAEVTAAAVWAYSGCPPAAFCALVADDVSEPVSALVGIRVADGTATTWNVADVESLVLDPQPILGYDTDRFIDGLLNSVAARRSS